MGLELCTIGGFDRTEGNSVAIKVDDEVVILDMGLGMESYIKYTEDLHDVHATKEYKDLRRVGAVPDYRPIKEWIDKTLAIIPSHAHLDHVGAIPFGAPLFPASAKILGTPYTAEVLKTILHDERLSIPQEIVSCKLNSSYKLSSKITVEFVAITHSIIHTAILVIHTPYGSIAYANDYKLDNNPVLGAKPNYKRLEQLGDKGVKLLIVNCLYAHEHKKCPSESVARQMLKETMLDVNSSGRAMIVTTFSSHLARLKSIIEFGRKLNRKIVFLGRSLHKYTTAAERLNLVNFSKDVSMHTRRRDVENVLRRIQKEGKDKYLIVCTGHQGEPRAILSRIARKELHFKFDPGDIIVFSCAVIPVPINQKNRAKLDATLKSQGCRLFCDVHVSGHGALEDHHDLLNLLRPSNIIPIHAEEAKAQMLLDFAKRLGFKNGSVSQDGRIWKL